MTPDVSVVIVSYNTRAMLDDCLRRVMDSRDVALEVFVVDNASSDGSADHVEASFPDVHVVRNPDNRGFAAANNAALRRARGRHLLLLNPDTLVEPGTIATLAHFLDARPKVGITGPKVMNRDGSLQSCGYWYPSLREEILLSRNVRKLGRLVLGQPRDLPPCDRASDVDWVDGCCLLIRREVVERIGLLDEQYFLYAEELDWCRSARKDGWIITTCPDARMIHLQGQSTQQVKATALAHNLLEHPRRGRSADHDDQLRLHDRPAVPELLERGEEPRAAGGEPRDLVEEHDLLGPAAREPRGHERPQLLERALPVSGRRRQAEHPPRTRAAAATHRRRACR